MSATPGADDEHIGLRARRCKHPRRFTPLNAAPDRHFRTSGNCCPMICPSMARASASAFAGVPGHGAHNL
jgi:hypothetical protein